MSKFSKSSIFYIIFLFVFVVSFSGFLSTGITSELTFVGLLNYLSNAPKFDISLAMVDLTIYGNWGPFEFFRIYLNWFTTVWEVVSFIFGMIYQGLSFIIYLVKGLFLI